MKKIFTLLCVAFLATSLLANVVTGTCGDNLQWAYDTDTHALTITGSGDMWDYVNWGDDTPWAQVASAITSVSLLDGVTSIGGFAFYNCRSLTSITIPNSVTSIGKYAFLGCSSLTSVTIGNSVESIGYYAFGGCSSLTSITIPESVTNIGSAAFCNCSSLTSITIPNSVTSIGGGAFDGCSSLSSITIPNSVTSIGGLTFSGCSSLKSVTIPNSVTNAGGGMFYGCSSLQYVMLSKNITALNPDDIGGGQMVGFFENCSSLNSVTLPNNLTSIGELAFSGCNNLTVTIPSSVTTIGWEAFASCSQVTMQGTTPPSISENTFNNNATIFVPCSAMDNYLSAPIWQFMDLKGYNYKVNLTSTYGGSAKIVDSNCSNNTVTIEAYPAAPENENSAFEFKQWSDGNTDNPRTLTLTKDLALEAQFEYISYIPREYTVTLTGTELSGRYDTQWGSEWFGYTSHITFTVPEGSSVQLAENSYCGEWLGWSDGSYDRERTIVVTSDTTISSRFDVATYSVSITAGEGGYLENGDIEFEFNECNRDWIYTCAYAYDGYYFAGWSDGNTSQCIDIYPDTDINLVAQFAPKKQVQLLLGVDNACKNMGSVSGSGIYYSGDYVTITATPNAGYHFVEWSDGNGDATRELYLQSDTTLFATFAPGECGGKCGENLYWTYGDNTITITGSGDMDLYAYSAWHNDYDWYYNVTAVQFPEGITSIDDYAFYEMSLISVVVPASVTHFGENAFAYNNNLTRFEYLGTEAECEINYDGFGMLYQSHNLLYFKGQKDMLSYRDSYAYLDTVIITGGTMYEGYYHTTYIDNSNANNTYFEEGYLRDDVLAVETLLLPNGLLEIGDFALHNARHLEQITIPAGVTRIGESAFEECRSLESVTFAGKALREIDDWAFYNCHTLKNITIPEGVTEIGKAAFFDCTYLKEITLPSTTQTIADNAFGQCQKVGKMTVNAMTPPVVEAETFEDIDRSIPLYVPIGTALQYKAADYWCEFFNVIEYNAPSAVDNISSPNANTRKLLRDGQLLIIRDGKTYNIMGAEIR